MNEKSKLLIPTLYATAKRVGVWFKKYWGEIAILAIIVATIGSLGLLIASNVAGARAQTATLYTDFNLKPGDKAQCKEKVNNNDSDNTQWVNCTVLPKPVPANYKGYNMSYLDYNTNLPTQTQFPVHSVRLLK